MTGFARVDGHLAGTAWTFEIKSVNGRGLDLRCRLPGGFDSVESAARIEISKAIVRGSLNLTLTVTRAAAGGTMRINRELLAQVLELAREIEGAGAAPPRLDALLSVRGIIEPVDEDAFAPNEAVEVDVRAGLPRLVAALVEARLGEGARLVGILNGHLDEIARLVGDAAATAETQPAALRDRLLGQLRDLLGQSPPPSEERLAQEVALLVAKADVREELDRLRAHVAAARDLLAEGGAIGRRFDFLCQEFNREANTLCSKSADAELTRIGLALKAVIEQLREQVQNVE
jgi:uncharacterized protein (TIGR00255 family)